MISARGINIPDFTELVIKDKPARDFIMCQLVNNRDINVYYNSYMIVAPACEKHPELFYEYTPDVIKLLGSNISYHRNIGMEVLSSLARVDSNNYIEKILNKYFGQIEHKSLVTKRYCVKGLGRIAVAKDKLRTRILKFLLSVNGLNSNTKNARQAALLTSDIIEVLTELYTYVKDKKQLREFVQSELKSISPRTRKTAREFLNKYGS
jgi:hypothetical protein